MRDLFVRLSIFSVLTLVLCSAAFAQTQKPPTQEELAFFEKNIRPVLVKSCYQCHSTQSKDVKGGLLLDTREGIRRGGDLGHAVVPGNLKESVILEALRYEGLEMPPKEQLPPQVIANFEKWIKMGAPDPRVGKSAPIRKTIDFEKAKQFWAFQPIQKQTPPQVADNSWSGNAIDQFLQAQREAKQLKPAAAADPRVLVRRVYFDLWGMPPTPEQVEAFVNNPSPAAYEKLIDTLMASPHFGERWGRHWLDVVRYGESTGMERNYTYPQAWRFRDYVIQSFHEDKPFDQFLTEQLAGDLLPAKNLQERLTNITATGVLAMGPKSLNERNREQFLMDIVDEQIDVTTRAFLGLTVSCARCHDHKFDPVPTSEYYALAGIFRSTNTHYGTGGGNGNRQAGPLLAVSESGVTTAGRTQGQGRNNKNKQNNRVKQLNTQLKKSQKNLARIKKINSPTPAQQKRIPILEEQIVRLQRQIRNAKRNSTPAVDAPKSDVKPSGPVTVVMGVQDAPGPTDTPIRLRGEPNDRGRLVPRGFLTIASHDNSPTVKPDQSGRLELAQWLTDTDNPLTARVTVNRLWAHLFGRGIVATVNNFGANGERPTHPELLDYLATEFVADGWSVKTFVKQVMMTRTYQLSSIPVAGNEDIDPDNELLWKMNHRRLEVEAIRDAMLAASGQLDLEPEKGSIVARIGDGNVGRNLNPAQFSTKNQKRSVYLPIVRGALPEILRVFDFPEPSIIFGQRNVTTVPTQALYMMNSPFVMEQSNALAKLLHTHENMSQPERIKLAYLRTLSREPSPRELASVQSFLEETTETMKVSKTDDDQASVKAWSAFCQALFASAEFRYLE